MNCSFYQVDVFTNIPFGGNPLAVVFNSEGLTDQNLQNIAMETAMQLSKGATKAYGAVKTLLADSFSSTLESHLEQEARSLNIRAQGHDGKEGVKAFIEKRKPDFKGY